MSILFKGDLMAADAGARTTLVLSRADIAGLASPRDYFAAMQAAFLALAGGSVRPAPVGHVPAFEGGFHIKSAVLDADPRLVAIKINGNFPANPQRSGLPTIQGCLMLADAADGRLLALMDSIEITARRTAAATALAASHLARRSSTVLALVGCGVQARCHLDAMLALDGFGFRALRLFDPDPVRMAGMARQGAAAGLAVHCAGSAAEAARSADLVILATTATEPVLQLADVAPGMFVAAVGADSPAKSEVAPPLMAHARVVPDVLAQAVELGDLRRALADGAMTAEDIHGELCAVVAGTIPGRRDDREIFVFDSTGTAVEDVAAAAMLYSLAKERGIGLSVALNA
jgi:alanine dehydrogenase